MQAMLSRGSKDMAHVLVVEDDRELSQLLADYLLRDGHRVDQIHQGGAVLQRLTADMPDLILLDLMLPGMDGLEILRQLRRRWTVPVILVTARVEEVDRLIGLESGADDYVCKPFSPREVVARVRAILRRVSLANSAGPSDSEWSVDRDARQVRFRGQLLELTAREFDLFEVLTSRPGRVLSRRQLLDLIYADTLDVTERAIDSHVKNLRRKLAQVGGGQDCIRSVYGVGFSFEGA